MGRTVRCRQTACHHELLLLLLLPPLIDTKREVIFVQMGASRRRDSDMGLEIQAQEKGGAGGWKDERRASC